MHPPLRTYHFVCFRRKRVTRVSYACMQQTCLRLFAPARAKVKTEIFAELKASITWAARSSA